jgi:hypothetical protein
LRIGDESTFAVAQSISYYKSGENIDYKNGKLLIEKEFSIKR